MYEESQKIFIWIESKAKYCKKNRKVLFGIIFIPKYEIFFPCSKVRFIIYEIIFHRLF